MKVLIVEDEIRIRNGLAKLLESYDELDVLGKAKNGAEGYEMIEKLEPDIVFTDIRMPELDGLQMLEKLKRDGKSFHTVILTGYAEFEYAQKAISLGAEDYLLKPISVDDVEKIISQMEDKIRRESMRLDMDPESYFKALIEGIIDENDGNLKKAAIALNIDKDKNTFFISGYKKNNSMVRPQLSDVDILSSIARNGKILYMLVQGRKSIEELERQLCKIQNLDSEYRDMLFYVEKIDSVREINAAAKKSKEMTGCAQRLGKGVLTSESCEKIRWKKLEADNSIQEKLEKILCDAGSRTLDDYIAIVREWLMKDHYSMDSVRNSLKDIALSQEKITEKLWKSKADRVRKLETAGQLDNAYTIEEMTELIASQAKCIMETEERKDNISNYTIFRAIAYIRENYMDHISQEEVAEHLSITPEYLSTLFNREMHVNFASFVNEFRISHAKRLLKGSELKVYEIAGKVGFSDTKYFNRVFKDITGLSPREFREK